MEWRFIGQIVCFHSIELGQAHLRKAIHLRNPWEKCSFVCCGEMGAKRALTERNMYDFTRLTITPTKQINMPHEKPYHILQHSQRQKHPISVQNVTERHTIVIQVGFKNDCFVGCLQCKCQ